MASRQNNSTPSTGTNVLLGMSGTLALVFLGYIAYRAYQSEVPFLSILIIPLLLGILLESYRLSKDWSSILAKIIGALLLSTLAFLPNRNETVYHFEEHISVWPYWFIGLFVILSAVYHEDKIIPRLTEGIVLVQSIAILYWVADLGWEVAQNFATYVAISIGLIFSAFSILHAFTYLSLSRSARLWLSIWSSIITIIFAIDHICRVLTRDEFVNHSLLNEGLNHLQYFLLGISLIYSFQNALMLLDYLPSKTRFYGKAHLKDIRIRNKIHIQRFAEQQTEIIHSLLIVFVSASFYFANFYLQWLPSHTMIWFVFWLTPYFLEKG